ncbi:MAG: NADH-quinone oxidoreductase subunit J [Desulfuromonadaceae bacterium]
MELLFFYLVALVAVLSGFLVIKCKSPINSAISLVMTFFCLAVFYVMLNSPFMAAIQIIVYAGAIIVLIIFVIMLLNLGPETKARTTHALAWGSVVGALSILKGGAITTVTGEITDEVVLQVGHTELIGQAMFTNFLLPFEIASVLLLVAIVGAVVLTKKEV